MIELRVEGTDEFRELARKLKAAGDGRLVREMRQDMRAAANPAKEAAQRNVRALKITGLPYGDKPREPGAAVRRTRGSGRSDRYQYTVGRSRKRTDRSKATAFGHSGLREATARATTIEVNTSAKSARVRIRCRRNALPENQRKLPMHMNKGKWRHPVFGDRKTWATSVADPAWFDDAAVTAGPKCRDAARDVINSTNEKLAR